VPAVFKATEDEIEPPVEVILLPADIVPDVSKEVEAEILNRKEA
jgi:hypothetical protein